MYIKEIHISEYKILNDLKIQLQPPADGNNIINVIAGINGTGKTSLLKSIIKGLADITFPENVRLTLDKETERKRNITFPENVRLTLDKETERKRRKSSKLQQLIKHFEKNNEQVIYFASFVIDEFVQVSQLDTEYYFINQLKSEKILGNAEYYIREYVLAHERNNHEANPTKRTRAAVDSFNQCFQEANLLTELHDLDPKHFNRPVFKQKGNNTPVTIEHLSDGEIQVYGLVVALMILNPSNSIILIDEPELALHPAWQQVIMSIYAKIGQNNQFIIATHSPQIIATTSFNNLILLRKNIDSHKIEAIYPNHPPSGIDINSILTEFMGTNFISNEQVDLYRQYRKFVEQRQENSESAKEIKQKILERESNTSKFMQEMQFIIQLREE